MPRIVVVGSAHIDTVVSRTGNNPPIDAPGEVTHSIGGGAYNIAVSLGLGLEKQGFHTILLSILPKYTDLTKIIIQRLRLAHVNTRSIRIQDVHTDGKPLRLGGYVSMRDKETGEIIYAATETNIERVLLFERARQQRKFKRLIKQADAVVFDTNLNQESLRKGIELCRQNFKPVFVALVSDAKADRLADACHLEDSPIFCLSGRSHEIAKVLRKNGVDQAVADSFEHDARLGLESLAGLSPLELCQLAKTQHILITPRTSDTFYLISAAKTRGEMLRFKLNLEGVSRIGVGDAVTAALVAKYVEHTANGKNTPFDSLDLTESHFSTSFQATSNEFSSRSLHSQGATPNSTINFSERDIHTTLARRLWRSFIAYIDMRNWILNIIVGLIVSTLVASAVYFNYLKTLSNDLKNSLSTEKPEQDLE